MIPQVDLHRVERQPLALVDGRGVRHPYGHVGDLAERDGRECLVLKSRRIWYWKDACTLSQLAMEGSKSIDECKIAMKVPEILLTEVIEVIPMSEKAITNIMGAKEWKK